MGESNKVYTKVLSKNIPHLSFQQESSRPQEMAARQHLQEHPQTSQAEEPTQRRHEGRIRNNNRGAHLRLDEWMCMLTDDILRVNTGPPGEVGMCRHKS